MRTMSVRLSVTKPPASQNHAYQQNLNLLAIMPLSHHALPPSQPLRIITIGLLTYALLRLLSQFSL